MKKSLFLFIFSFNVFSQEVVTLNDVTSKVKNENFQVLENAQRVYQAKEMIHFSKRSLLPKLNFWNIIKIPFEWSAVIDVVQDIAPFMVPNNWFQLRQNEVFYDVQKAQYKALSSNQVMTARLLYLNALRDIDTLKLVENQLTELNEILEIARTRNILGDIDTQDLNFLEVRRLQILEDKRSLESIIFEERKSLAYLMGVPQEKSIELKEVPFLDSEELKEISPDTYMLNAVETSPEIAQYIRLKDALKFTRKKAYFSFMGASSISASLPGGAFSHIPVQDGLGFGMSSTVRISRSEGHILDLNKEATAEVIKKGVYVTTNLFNSYVFNYENQAERLKFSTENYQLVKSHFILGNNISPLELLTAIENTFEASFSFLNYKYELLNLKEKIERYTFTHAYSDGEF